MGSVLTNAAPEGADPWNPVECPPSDHYLDPLIAPWVRILNEHGIATSESCQATPGHFGRDALGFPWILFKGPSWVGYQALAVAMEFGWPVSQLRREWRMRDGELQGPEWRLTFAPFSRAPC